LGLVFWLGGGFVNWVLFCVLVLGGLVCCGGLIGLGFGGLCVSVVCVWGGGVWGVCGGCLWLFCFVGFGDPLFVVAWDAGPAVADLVVVVVLVGGGWLVVFVVAMGFFSLVDVGLFLWGVFGDFCVGWFGGGCFVWIGVAFARYGGGVGSVFFCFCWYVVVGLWVLWWSCFIGGALVF
jgi:hypothetical protein